MAEKRFVWLSESCEARNGARLEKGKTYGSSPFNPDVVDEWIRTGAAKWTGKAKEGE
jgi:hypothetical protein